MSAPPPNHTAAASPPCPERQRAMWDSRGAKTFQSVRPGETFPCKNPRHPRAVARSWQRRPDQKTPSRRIEWPVVHRPFWYRREGPVCAFRVAVAAAASRKFWLRTLRGASPPWLSVGRGAPRQSCFQDRSGARLPIRLWLLSSVLPRHYVPRLPRRREPALSARQRRVRRWRHPAGRNARPLRRRSAPPRNGPRLRPCRLARQLFALVWDRGAWWWAQPATERELAPGWESVSKVRATRGCGR